MDRMPPSRPLIVGLTGSFGSGKSTVARMFGELGARVVDADQLAHEALEPASPVFATLSKEFADALSAEGGAGLSRKKLAVVVFNDPARRSRLEAIIHPYVFGRMEEEIQKAAAPLVILDVPLLFETGYDAQCAKTIYVEASAPVIARRLEKKGFSQGEIDRRNAAQMTGPEKKAKADFTIGNSETLEKTREEVRRIFHRLLSDSKGASK